MLHECPVCGDDMLKDVSETKRLLAPLVVSEYCDPGGRAIGLSTGVRFRLFDCCNACDEAKIKEVLGL